MRDNLTRMQRKVYHCIEDSIRIRGYPPTVREICEALRLKSPSTVHFHIRNLVERGYLVKDAGKDRALALAERAADDSPGSAPPDAAPGGAFFTLGVEDGSLRDAGLLPGDLVVFRRQDEAEPGVPVAVLLEGRAVIRMNPPETGAPHGLLIGRAVRLIRRY